MSKTASHPAHPAHRGNGIHGILQDEDGGTGRPGRMLMSLADFTAATGRAAQALPRRKFDLLLYEMCLMGQTDVLAASRNLADYIVASPRPSPSQCSDFLRILPFFRRDIDTRRLA